MDSRSLVRRTVTLKVIYPFRSTRRAVPWLIAAVVALMVLALVVPTARRARIADALREWNLERAASRSPYRVMTARVVGLAYVQQPTAHTKRSGDASDHMLKIAAAASRVLDGSKSPHLRGKAMLLEGETARAIELLREASKTGDAAAQSDLAAALLAEAEELDAYEPALDAVVAARKAIERSPDLAAAHFNLGLALDRLGLTTEARAELETAAACEPGSPWAAEAHSRSVQLRTDEADWGATELLLRATADPAARKALIRENAERARTYGEGPYLADWAQARIDGHPEAAQLALGLARTIGIVLGETSGDLLVTDAVAAIDRAEESGDEVALRMASSLVTYAAGRKAHKEGDMALAITALTRSATVLAELGSPVQYIARYYRSGALYEETRIDEALDEIESLDREHLEEKHYRGLSAQLGWSWGSCLLVRGSYAEALHQFNRSYDMSIAIGEQELASDFDGLAAEALEYLGQSREGWQRRSRALRAYSASARQTYRKMVTLTGAANLQLAARNPARANALLEYALPLALQLENARVAAHAFAQRSVARDELGDAIGAASDRLNGSAWVKRIQTPRLRERLKAEIDIAEGVAKRESKPREAVVHFTRAIDLLWESRQSSSLPRLYFERARAHEAARDVQGMRQDLLAGRAVVAEWEKSIGDLEQRAAISVWSEAMRRELISLELGAGDVRAAFSHADDRQTAATVRDRARLTLTDVQGALAPGAAILELATTRERVIAFIIRGETARAVTLPESAARIAAAAETMRNADDETFPVAAARLHDLILAPILRHLNGVTTLAVVPDRELAGIPFSALRDATSDRYLIERVAVVHSDTADAAITLSRRAREPRGSSLLSIGASVFDHDRNPGAAALPAVDREATAVAKQSRGSRLLLGDRATPETVRRELSAAAGVHYAGHIVGRGTDARLLLAPVDGHDSLTARDISGLRLGRTRFVVLAACRGSGTSEPNAIVRDMATGFLKAGVPTVVASATDVDDAEAPPTMLRLHSFLSDGGDAADALRRTARLDRQQGKKVPLSIRLLVMGGSQALVR